MRPRIELRLVGAHWLMLIALVSGGCTSMQPVEGGSESLRQQIRNGSAVEVGDSVEIVTENGEILAFKVTGVGGDVVAGDSIEVPIDSIRSMQIRNIDTVKTGATVAGVGLGFYLIMGLLLAAVGPALIL